MHLARRLGLPSKPNAEGMREIATRAALLSLSRVASRGLMLVSPIVLVRLLTMEEFGRYREFMVYSTLMHAFAGLLINSSLLSFVPARPERTWQYVRQSVMLVAVTSTLAVGILVAVDTVLGGRLTGDLLVPIALYTLFFVNFDFWQSLWVAEKKAALVVAYTTGRMLMRIAVAIGAALLTRDVMAIIWSIVGFELLRMGFAGLSWWRRDRKAHEPAGSSWREHIAFCWPLGAASIVGASNTRVGAITITKYGGPTALAEYSIGTYVEPVVQVLRNSLSEAVLPDLVAQRVTRDRDPLILWRRATVVYTVFMVPAAILLGWYAEPLVVTLFSPEYRAAAPLMQVYVLVLLRECFDFSILLRAANQTLSFLYNSALSLAINVLWLVLLVPVAGLIGAVLALVIARYCEAVFMCIRVCKTYEVSVGFLVPWRELGKVALAAAAGASILVVLGRGRSADWGVIISTSLGFLALFGAMLWVLRLRELPAIWRGVKRLVPALRR